MQLRLDAADRLVELVEERRGPVFVEEAARRLFALRHAPVGMARSLLEEVVVEDARLAWRGDAVGLADPPGADLPLDRATFVVVDLETTGLRPGSARICEIGAVRVRELELADEFELLVDPGMPIGPAISALTGLRDADLRGAPHPAIAVRRFLEFAGDAVLVAHNALFDVRFINHEVAHVFPGRRMMNSHLCTVALARQLLPDLKSFRLGALAEHFSVPHRSRHRAGDDAHATARVFIRLLEHLHESGVRDLDGARRFKRPKAEVNTHASEAVETQSAATEI